MRAALRWLAVTGAGAVTVAGLSSCGGHHGPYLLSDDFTGPDGPIAAEHEPSGTWEMTSGVLRRLDDRGWTGVPTATTSAVFRMVSRDEFPAGVTVGVTITARRFVSTERTPEHDYDGVHIMLRRRSANELYYVSVLRRDGAIVVKKKLPDPEGGRYVTIGRPARLQTPLGRPRRFDARATTLRTGAVEITLTADGRRVLDVVDHNDDGPALRDGGAIGVRGDNLDFTIDRVRVRRPPSG